MVGQRLRRLLATAERVERRVEKRGLSHVYTILIRGCGLLAALMFAVYLTATITAAADPGGIELPPAVRTLASIGIVTAAVVSAGGWLIDRANRISAERDIRYIVATEVQREFAKMRAALLEDVAGTVEAGLARAQRYGVLAEAQNRANGEAQNRVNGTVTALRREGD